MKKKIASLALIAMSLVAFPSMAENKAAKKADNTATTCAVAQCGDRPSRQACLFEGMNLTEAQQTQLQELNRQQREARKAKAEAFKKEAREAKKDLKEQKMQRDSVAMAERKAEKKAYLEKVKAIIGADNYVTFLENYYINGDAPRMNMGPRKGNTGMGRKDGARAFRGERRGNGQRLNGAAK